jgi:putative tricarboxylic transport membrane protein
VRHGDIASGALLAALGFFFVAAGRDLGLGRLSDPGSGFLIFWVGLILIALSSGVVVVAWRSGIDGEGGTLRSVWAGANWRKVGYVVLVLAVYAWALPTLGFLLATVVLLLVLFRTVEPQSWTTSVVGSAVATLAAWLLFVKALGTQLPTGLWGVG